jgi:3-hydroxyisobutyrate dehydrogenase-like beta-hydroxyacid dehydrogenase
MRVGWIGAGRMGSQMALRAAEAGHAMSIFAIEVAQASELRAAGAIFATSAAEATRNAEVVCLCLFSDEQTRSVMLTSAGAPTEAFAAMSAGAVLVIHSSGSATLARELAAAAPAGVRVIDAPFSGQDAHVRERALTVLAGGEPDAVEAARPVIESYGKLSRVGPLGSGQAIKLANQLLYRANLEAAEAAVRAIEAQGIDRGLAVRALLDCSGASFALGHVAQGPSIADRRRTLKPYFDVYFPAIALDGLDLSLLTRMSALAEENERAG